jgi:hypothetical protein
MHDPALLSNPQRDTKRPVNIAAIRKNANDNQPNSSL